jgi:hypothetical protein
MRLEIMPIYGWGWTDSNGAPVDVPLPFQLEVRIFKEGEPFRAAMGYNASDMDHPLANCWIVLLQRHNPNDGNYNLLSYEEEPVFAGDDFHPLRQTRMTGFALANPA